MSGMPIGDTFIVYLNKDYRKDGDLELDKLFTINKISDDVASIQKVVSEEIQQALSATCSPLYLKLNLSIL